MKNKRAGNRYTMGPLMLILNVHDSQCLHAAAAAKDGSKSCKHTGARTSRCLIIHTIGQAV